MFLPEAALATLAYELFMNTNCMNGHTPYTSRTGGGNITVTTERLRQRRCRASLHKVRETKDLKRKSERTMKETAADREDNRQTATLR